MKLQSEAEFAWAYLLPSRSLSREPDLPLPRPFPSLTSTIVPPLVPSFFVTDFAEVLVLGLRALALSFPELPRLSFLLTVMLISPFEAWVEYWVTLPFLL